MKTLSKTKKNSFSRGEFYPTNPQKYRGGTFPTYRSGWELTFMNFLDKHPYVLLWASEQIEIPYCSPLDNRIHRYYPDFFVVYKDKNSNIHRELIEIKPLSQTLEEMARSKYDKEQVLINKAKWQAALAWCNKNNIQFRIMTQQQIYQQAKRGY